MGTASCLSGGPICQMASVTYHKATSAPQGAVYFPPRNPGLISHFHFKHISHNRQGSWPWELSERYSVQGIAFNCRQSQ